MRISDWSSDVCSSDLERADDDQCHAQPNHYVIVIEVFRLTPDRRFPNCNALFARRQAFQALHAEPAAEKVVEIEPPGQIKFRRPQGRQFPINQGLHLALIVEHYVGGRSVPPKHVDQIGRATSELQSLMRISYAVFCLKKKRKIQQKYTY